MRTITEAGFALIKRFEGFSPKPYADVAGVPTIGYGHAIRPEESYTTLTVQEATALLAVDVRRAQASVLRLIIVPLSDGQFDALVSFVFNLGSGRLQASTLRRKINRGESGVEQQFMRWVYAGGIKRPGLINRRMAEAALYSS